MGARPTEGRIYHRSILNPAVTERSWPGNTGEGQWFHG
jgi:hypothetical protein